MSEANEKEETIETIEKFLAEKIDAVSSEVIETMDDFAALMEGSFQDLKLHFEKGEKVIGKVCRIDDKNIYLDIKSTQEGLIDKVELINDEGQLSVIVGDTLEAFVVDTRKGISLSVKLTGDLLDSNLEDAFKSGIPVEGKFIAERKGGYTVQIGKEEAFCPYSQADLFTVEGKSLIGLQGLFIITQYSNRDMVVSRKKVLLQEQQKQKESLKWSLKVGDRLHGEVIKIMDFGAFVELGGIQGMIPVSELTYAGKRVTVGEILSVGDRVEVIVKAINWEADKITLSYRGAKTSWSDIEAEFEQGMLCEGIVTRIEPYGAFIEIDDEVEGLLHVSSIADSLNRRIKSVRDILKEGDTVIVEIESVDVEKHRISLLYALENLTEEDKQYIKDKSDGVGVGQTYTGTISAVKPFGVIVDLGAGRSGMLHQSVTGGKVKHKMGEKVEVVVKEVSTDGKRVSLVVKGEEPEAEENALAEWMKLKNNVDTAIDSTLNTMAGLLNGLKF